jgi:hypothetical protein
MIKSAIKPGLKWGSTRPIIASAVLILALMPIGATGQTIPLTDKLTQLHGTWALDPTRGVGGICGVPVTNSIAINVSAKDIRIETDQWTGVLPLDRKATSLSDGRTAAADVDAGWLAITMRRPRSGTTNVMQEVYIVKGNELTVWRVLNVIFADGSQGKIDCGNRHAIVYVRK